MVKRLLILADPLKSLKTQTDTGLGLAYTFDQRKWKVFWSEFSDLDFFKNKILLRKTSGLSFLDSPENFLSDEKKIQILLEDFDLILIRKDPPFDFMYQTACWLLQTIQKDVPIFNNPESLLKIHEKLFPWLMLQEGVLQEDEIIPTYLPMGRRSREDWIEVKTEILGNDEWIQKPWFGFGGEAVEKFSHFEHFLNENQKNDFSLKLYQKYDPSVQTGGDRRVFLIAGKPVATFARIPGPGQLVSNIARGGSADFREMTEKEKRISLKTAQYIDEKGIIFGGLDLLGERLSEVNITSPTGLRTYQKYTGTNLLEYLVHEIMAKI